MFLFQLKASVNLIHVGTEEYAQKTLIVTYVLARPDSWVKIANVSKMSMSVQFIYVTINVFLEELSR